MPQNTRYSDIIFQLFDIMQTVTSCKSVQTYKSYSLVGSEGKIPLPISVNAIDMIRLSWIFMEWD